MDSLLSVYEIIAAVVLAVSFGVLLLALFLPTEQRKKVVHTVGRWWMGL